MHFPFFCGLERFLFYFFLLLQVAAHEEADDEDSHDEGDKSIHGSARLPGRSGIKRGGWRVGLLRGHRRMAGRQGTLGWSDRRVQNIGEVGETARMNVLILVRILV